MLIDRVNQDYLLFGKRIGVRGFKQCVRNQDGTYIKEYSTFYIAMQAMKQKCAGNGNWENRWTESNTKKLQLLLNGRDARFLSEKASIDATLSEEQNQQIAMGIAGEIDFAHKVGSLLFPRLSFSRECYE